MSADYRDALLAEAARLLRFTPDACLRGGGAGGQTIDNMRPCGECRRCQVRAWLARYEAERGGQGWAVISEGYRCAEIARTENERASDFAEIDEDPVLGGAGADYLRGWRDAAKRIEDAICRPRDAIAARTAPAAPGKEDGE
jgi:hypothetical protein